MVQHVSADRLVDETTGDAHILARIAVDAAALNELSAVAGETLELLPGMPAEVMILTGERTTLDYAGAAGGQLSQKLQGELSDG